MDPEDLKEKEGGQLYSLQSMRGNGFVLFLTARRRREVRGPQGEGGR
jgi:hypothetical protein